MTSSNDSICRQMSSEVKWKNLLINLLSRDIMVDWFMNIEDLEYRLSRKDILKIYIPTSLIGQNTHLDTCMDVYSNVHPRYGFEVTQKHVEDIEYAKHLYFYQDATVVTECIKSKSDPTKFILVIKVLGATYVWLSHNLKTYAVQTNCTEAKSIYIFAKLKITFNWPIKQRMLAYDILLAAPEVEVPILSVKRLCDKSFPSEICLITSPNNIKDDWYSQLDHKTVQVHHDKYQIFELYLDHLLDDNYFTKKIKQFKYINPRRTYASYYLEMIKPYTSVKVHDFLSGPAIPVFKSELTHLLSETALVESRVPVINPVQSKKAVEAYTLLLERANKFPSYYFNNDAKFKEYVNVLDYLRMMIIIRIGYLKDTIESDLVTNVPGYLETVSQDLSAISLTNERVKSIVKQKENYAKEINNKIKEGVKLIEKEITPEFANLEKRMQDKLKGIINKALELAKATSKQIQELKQKKKEAEQNFILSTICSIFKFVGTVVGKVVPILGPVIEVGIDQSSNLIQAGGRALIGSTKVSTVNMPGGVGERRKRDAEKEIADERKKNEAKAKHIENLCKDFTAIVDGYYQYSSSNADIDEQLEKARRNEKKLNDFINKIREDVIPFIQKLVEEMRNERGDMKQSSRIALEVKQLKVKNIFDDLGMEMKQLAEGFPQEQDLLACVKKYSDAMAVMMKVFDHIQTYEENRLFAEYVGNLHIQNNKLVEYQDPEFDQFATKFKDMLKKSMALKSYKTALTAIKQFVFPLAQLYTKKQIAPVVLELLFSNDTDNMITNAMMEMNYLTKQFNFYKTSIHKHDSYLGVGEFDSTHVSGNPFYIWKPNKYKDALDDLLRGKEVYFFANIDDSLCKQDAIKMSKINFSINAFSRDKQTKLIESLKSFQMVATHLGDNYYRFKHQIFMISTSVQKIWYSIEKNSIDNNEPLHTSGTYNKISNGDFMLSPFATWKLQLAKATVNADLRNLHEFLGQVSLELGGRGFYIDLDKLDDEEIDVLTYYADNFVRNETLKNVEAITNQQRKKRSFDVSYAKNSAAYGVPSTINYLCNLVKESVMNFGPLQQVKTLFSVDAVERSPILSDHSFNKLNSAVFKDYAMINDELLSNVNAPSGLISNEFNKDQDVPRDVQYGSFNFINNDNLALLSFAVNKYTKAKCSSKKLSIDDLTVNERKNQYAQMLAYSAQAPKLFN